MACLGHILKQGSSKVRIEKRTQFMDEIANNRYRTVFLSQTKECVLSDSVELWLHWSPDPRSQWKINPSFWWSSQHWKKYPEYLKIRVYLNQWLHHEFRQYHTRSIQMQPTISELRFPSKPTMQSCETPWPVPDPPMRVERHTNPLIWNLSLSYALSSC